MPTPMPIMAASVPAKLGIENTLASNVTSPSPMPMPKSATRIGKPMARTEPKAMSRMMMAAPTPTISVTPGSLRDWNMLPESATVSWGLLWAEAIAMIWSVVDLGRCWNSTSKSTWA